MKKLFFLLTLLISVSAYAQDTMEPEIVYFGDGKVVMNDGSVLTGTIHYSLVRAGHLKFTGADGNDQKIKIADVKEFFISGDHYVKIPTTAISLGSKNDIALQKSSDDAKIKVYELVQQDIVGSGNNDVIKYETSREILVLFPGMDKPKSVGDISFMPFNKKVSKLVADCPELSTKILNKENGYKLGLLVTYQMKMDLYMKISEEYQNCGK